MPDEKQGVAQRVANEDIDTHLERVWNAPVWPSVEEAVHLGIASLYTELSRETRRQIDANPAHDSGYALGFRTGMQVLAEELGLDLEGEEARDA